MTIFGIKRHGCGAESNVSTGGKAVSQEHLRETKKETEKERNEFSLTYTGERRILTPRAFAPGCLSRRAKFRLREINIIVPAGLNLHLPAQCGRLIFNLITIATGRCINPYSSRSSKFDTREKKINFITF
ncbi:hypothetical protein PUN28_018085 [Cardiocondyla obscurior]|uniref:Uncharacterized protein n=1 Tax=Cardiocondyla obscurior TaxID=286306 RepID=A0AAW2EIF6_9HYME